MTREELDTLLQELTSEDLTTERQLEIFSAIRTDKEESTNNYNTLLANSEKLKNDYDSLKKKSIEDFFNVGTKVENPETQPIEPTQEEVKSYDEIVTDLLEKGVK